MSRRKRTPEQRAQDSPVRPPKEKQEQASWQHLDPFATVLDSLFEGCQAIDADWRYIYANPAFARQVHLTVAEVLHRTMMEVLPGIEDSKLFGVLRRCAEERTPNEVELEWGFPDGTASWFQLRIGPMTGGLFILSLDITERKRAESMLRASESRLAESQRVAQVGSWVLELPSYLLTWSEETYRIYGVAPETFVPSVDSLLPLVHADDRRAVQEWIEACVANKRPRDLEFRSVRPDGSIHTLSGRGQLMRDDAHGSMRMIGTVQDITQRKLLETQFLRAQKMEAVGRLASGIAHDFNNLLTVITTATELASMQVPRTDALQQDLEEIRGAGDRAAALTRRLLAFSHKDVLQPRGVKVSMLLERLRPLLRRLISEDIAISAVLAEDLGAVWLDPVQMEQVVVNLVVNARDAMPNGGTLTLETKNVELEDGDWSTHLPASPGPYVVLSIRDTGVGMDEATRQRLFEPFFTTKLPGLGIGLGLTTASSIVNQTGGSIRVLSEAGVGSTFEVWLPRVAADTPEPSLAPTGALARGTETILLVDDDDALRRVVARVLEKAGYTVLIAASGEEALRLLAGRQEPVPLTVTDVVMPGMTGREMAERLQVSHPQMKIIYTSGYTEDAISHHGALDAGLHFINKPYSSVELTTRVRKVLDE